MPGFPQTYATAEERLAVLDKLVATHPHLVWKFCHGYFTGRSFSESHRFRWRDAGANRRGLEPEDNDNNQKYMSGLLPRLSDLAVARENLVSATNEFARLPEDIRERLIRVLEEEINPVLLSQDERGSLLACIREALNWINSYGDEKKREPVPALYRLLERYAPEDVIERVGWLLSTPWPRLPQGEPREYDAKNTAVREAQESAARELLDKTSTDRILQFAGTVDYPGVLGYALGKVVRGDKEDAAVLQAMLDQAGKPLLIRGYARGRVEAVGTEWVDRQISRMKAEDNYSSEACALLYLGLPESAATWSAVGAHGKDVESAYWKHASGYSQASKEKDAPIAVEKLLDAKRPDAALEIAGDPHASFPSLLLQRLLQELLSMDKPIPAGAMVDFHLGHVFRQLYEQNELSAQELARLEWPFAEIFDEMRRYTSAPMALHRLLRDDPKLFAEFITLLYKRDDHAPDPTRGDVDEETVARRARIARRVLDSWRLMPGLKDDGTLDEKELTEWVETARKHCAGTNHVTGGDLQIGFMLARAPIDKDGAWPHIALRNLLERLNNEVIDRHIEIEIYNSRGVVTRGLTDGGEQERELAAKYRHMSEIARAKWPRTAALLRSLAESYEGQARHEDIDSDLRDLRWG